MPDINTKQKIINASIELFNEQGMANVRLQQIANKIGISAGNLAYHFRNKEAIIEAINEELIKKADEVLSSYRQYPNLLDFDYQLTQYYYFIQQFPFYYMDLVQIERHHPELNASHKEHIVKMISQIRKRFDFNQKRGVIKKESISGLYDGVAHTIWMLITFWGHQKVIQGLDFRTGMNDFKKSIWNQIRPYFTDQGVEEFEQLIQPLLSQFPSN